MRQKVLSIVSDDASLFETMSPIGVWGPDRTAASELPVEFVACAVEGNQAVVEGGLTLSGLGVLAEHISSADMIVVPTWPIHRHPIPDELIEQLVDAHERGTRIVGLCLGAYVVASTGLLNDKSATTHWRQRDRFEELFPAVTFEPNVLYVDHDTAVTSAGSAAAVDCCLHLVRKDHGAEAAARVARSLVTAPHRAGAQSQFASSPALDLGDDPLGRALSAATEDIASVRQTSDLADLAGMSRRSLERAIRARLGTTPKAWIDEQRVITACRLLETSELGMEELASTVGYGSTPTLRRALQKARGTTPTAHRLAFSQPKRSATS